jgi:flagellar basal-body rod protein FlgB
LAGDFFSDITSTALSKTLDAASARQRTIANNIANVETPGYKRRYVQFEEELKAALQGGGRDRVRRAVSNLTSTELTDAISPSRSDGNNVNIDAEMADLAKVGLKHRAAATLLEGKISMLRAAISEGKK